MYLEGYVSLSLSSWLKLNSLVRVKYLKEECPGFMDKADRKSWQGRIHQYRLSTAAIIRCLLSGAPPFSLERSVSRRQLRSDERASVSNSSSLRTRVAGSHNFVAKNIQKERGKKRKSDRHSRKNNDWAHRLK